MIKHIIKIAFDRYPVLYFISLIIVLCLFLYGTLTFGIYKCCGIFLQCCFTIAIIIELWLIEFSFVFLLVVLLAREINYLLGYNNNDFVGSLLSMFLSIFILYVFTLSLREVYLAYKDKKTKALLKNLLVKRKDTGMIGIIISSRYIRFNRIEVLVFWTNNNNHTRIWFDESLKDEVFLILSKELE